jgi:hypothetical protein
MFTVGQTVRGTKSTGALFYALFLVVAVYNEDREFDLEVVEHPDEDMVGELWEEEPMDLYELVSSPSVTYSVGSFPSVSKSITNPTVSSPTDLLALGLI